MSLAISASTSVSSSYIALSLDSGAASGSAPRTSDQGSATSFGASVTVSVSIAASSQSASEGAQALATLNQAQNAVREQNKKDAAAKLDEAIKELSLLRILGNTLEGAREAVKLAKQISSAVKEYAASGGGTSADSLSTVANDLTQATATLGDTVTAAGTANALSGLGTSGADASAATANGTGTGQQDPFYAIAGAALALLQKYLKKTLPALEASSDPKTQAEARKLAKEFAAAVSSAESAASATASGATGDSSGGATGNTGITSGSVGLAAPVSVNLVA